MADKGNGKFIFGSTTFDADDCLQSWDLDWSVEDVTYSCNGATKHLAGDVNAVFSCTVALAATDTTKVGALEPGTTGAWTGYPGGSTATYIKYTATKGTVISAPITAPVNGVIAVDVSIALDDCTDGAAT